MAPDTAGRLIQFSTMRRQPDTDELLDKLFVEISVAGDS